MGASAHVAFPEGEYNSNGTCPTSHPKRLVGGKLDYTKCCGCSCRLVFYEFIFQASLASQYKQGLHD